MADLMTRVNIHDFLVNFVGIPDEEVVIMPDHVKRDIVEDDYDMFVDFLEQGV